MPTAREGYKLADGTKVPSVTTILGRFKESGGLIHWAWDLGMKGLDYRKVRDEAANAGTIAHQWVEDHINWRDLTPYPDAPQEVLDNALRAYGAYLAWEAQTGIKVVHTEVGLVSEMNRFGGTLDAIGMIDGKLIVLDWKTSKGIFPEMHFQVAAYAALWNEHHHEDNINSAYICRFSKEVVSLDQDVFEQVYIPDLTLAWGVFQLALSHYQAIQNWTAANKPERASRKKVAA